MTQKQHKQNMPRKGTYFPGPVFHSHAEPTRWHFGKGGVRIIEFPKHPKHENSVPIVNEKARCIFGQFSIRERLTAETLRTLDALKRVLPSFHAERAA